MSDSPPNVLDHYRHAGLLRRLQSVLGAEIGGLSIESLAPLDQFHTRGLAATKEIAAAAEIGPEMDILDVGAGVGGPARFLAATYGCRVIGVDLSEEFTEASRYLTELAALSALVSFQTADALSLPFADGRFDAVFLQHVAMNVSDRTRLYDEMRRVLKPAGKFATFDVVLRAGEPDYPLPWARTPRTSFLLSADATRQAIERGGFRTVVWQDDTEVAAVWFAQLREAPAQPINLSVVMGPDFREFAINLGRNLADGRLGVVSGVFEAI